MSPVATLRDRKRPPARRSGSLAAGRTESAELAGWLADGRLPEVTPTRQQRSLRSTLAMLEAGRTLLADRALEDLSVEAVCARAGTTVGSFYGRFESKLAFFITLQRLQTIRSQQALAEFEARRATDAGFDAICGDIVQMTVANFRANAGVLRAALQHTQEGLWRVFKESGDRFRAVLLAQLTPHLSGRSAKQRELRILFAYEALAGVLVHATLNDPGPLGIDDPALPRELERLFKAYLTAPPG